MTSNRYLNGFFSFGFDNFMVGHNCAGIFKLWGQEPSRNRVVVPVRQATQSCRIGSLDSIPELLKSWKIWGSGFKPVCQDFSEIDHCLLIVLFGKSRFEPPPVEIWVQIQKEVISSLKSEKWKLVFVVRDTVWESILLIQIRAQLYWNFRTMYGS